MLLKKLLVYMLPVVLFSCSAKPNNSPAILVAAFDSGPGAAVLTFRQDKSCEWLSGIASNPQEGTYQTKDSLVEIEGISLGGALKSKHFLITNRNPSNKDSRDLILLQVDKQRNSVDKRFIFRVTVDKR
ncbi:hypothetical protein J0X19_04005 [Hymenobacter sp. BT186]|uniref:DUF4377 domain-containing protein n=1 Tax=Hymenobacter telluris TaxID=2816474 RepID=A0A939JBA1_9BACT|nr:hypothetical protein [Hymenobacter telluris]MBO0357100.1 hypothetical protein [Hymenobacter telluris]MBW3373127.1 hypothetical protein [Hymenobacter norwichensis]